MQHEKVSRVVKDNVPEFIKVDYQTFTSFLEKYFQFLEKENEIFINTSDSITVEDSATVLTADLIERPSAVDIISNNLSKTGISDISYSFDNSTIVAGKRIQDEYVSASDFFSISINKLVIEGPFLIYNQDYVDASYFVMEDNITDNITSLVTA